MAETEDESHGQEPFLVVNDARKAEVEHNGHTVWVEYKPMTRAMRNEAMELAGLEYKKRFPDDEGGGGLPSVFEYELFKRMVKRWGPRELLPKEPQLGYHELPVELGDKIMEKMGITDAIHGLGDEEEDAKNSQGDET